MYGYWFRMAVGIESLSSLKKNFFFEIYVREKIRKINELGMMYHGDTAYYYFLEHGINFQKKIQGHQC